MPPLAGWLLGADIDIRERIAMIDPNLATAERAARELDIRQLTAALADADVLGDERDAEAIVLAAHRYLASSNARIVMVQLEDIIGETTPVNIPGTNDEYPNWRRKVRDDIDAIASGRRFARFTAMLREMRPRV
jgi:4-alpha-glucanotransferase